MKTAVILLVVALSICVESSDLVVGSSYGNRLLWQTQAKYSGFPLKKTVKTVFYSDPAQQIIKGVIARDLDNKGAEATITSGGVGSSYVNIRLKSPRGLGLNYHIEIYA